MTTTYPQLVEANSLDIYVEQVGQGPDVLLIGGLGDTVESWQFQLDGLADRYRLTAFDNRGAGRTAMPDGPVSRECRVNWASTHPPATSRSEIRTGTLREPILTGTADPGDQSLLTPAASSASSRGRSSLRSTSVRVTSPAVILSVQ